jgi:hypothetical protein
MFEPVRTGGFGASGHLVTAGTFELDEVDYWYHTPFFWLVEENGVAILRMGSDGQDIGKGDPAVTFRMLSKPVFFANKLGLLLESSEGTKTTHLATGRLATEVPVHGSYAGSSATGTMTVDDETAIVLSVAVPDGPRLETVRFAVHDTMEAALFGAETLDTPGYYHGRLVGTDSV